MQVGREQVRSYLAHGVLVLLLIVQGTAFFSIAQTVPTISDPIGYVYAAQRLANGHGPTFEDANNLTAGPYFSMFAFQIRRTDDPRMFLGFPPGCSLLMAAGILLTGKAAAAYYVVPLLAVLGLVATFYVGVLISGNEWTGFWSAALLAFAPAYCEFGMSSWSEVPSLTFITAGVCLYLLSRTEGRSSRASIILSVLGGIVIVYSFFIRYSNVAIVPALAIYELFIARKRILTEWRRWIFFGFLGLGFVAILMFNHFYYGGPILTSYSSAHGWYPYPAFSLSYALGPSFASGYSLIEACKPLWQNFSWMALLVPMGWFLLKRASALLVSVAALSTVALYSVYAFAPKEINSRFLLPAFPFLVIAIATVITTAGAHLHSAK